MVANKSYWRGAPKIDEVIFQTYQNADTMVQDLKSGAIQGAWGLNGPQLKTLKSAPEVYGFDFVTKGFDELGVQLLHGRRLQGQPGAARRQLPPRPQLGDRQAEDRRGRLSGLRPAGRLAHAERLLAAAARLPLGPGFSRQGLRVRPRQGQGGPRRCRLQGRQRRRLPRAAERQADGDPPLGARRVVHQPELGRASSPAGSATSA